MQKLHEVHTQFLSAAPSKFTRKEAVEICTRLGFTGRWFDAALRYQPFMAELVKVAHGVYRKR